MHACLYSFVLTCVSRLGGTGPLLAPSPYADHGVEEADFAGKPEPESG